MQVVICALAKNEHLYINEWVKHYIKLGINKIYLYDNDDKDKPHVEMFIEEQYLRKVEIIDIRGVHEDRLQHRIYTEFYNTHTFDWCLFCDVDEFLTGVSNIPMWLSFYPYNVKQIRIMWRLFGDDDMPTRDTSVPLMKAFTKPITHSLHRNLNDKGNLERQGKMIVKGGLPNVIIKSPHFASFKTRENVIPSILPSGVQCYSKVSIKENYSKEYIYMNHYMTKTIEEFINQKMNRSDAVYGDRVIDLDYFWRINKKTPEKLKILDKYGIKY